MCKKTMLLCMIMVALFGFFQTCSAELVAHWSFDDGVGAIAVDVSGNGHDAVVEGGGDSAWVEGKLDDGIEVGNGVWVNVPPEAWAPIDNQFTAAFWALGYDGLGQNWGFYATAPGSNRMISNHLPWTDGNIYYDTADSAGAWNSERISKPLDPGLATGVWNHWAFTKNTDTGEKHVYLNGELWHSGANATGLVTEINVFTIGSGPNGSQQYLGVIDDFQLYDVELTQQEIRAAMQGISKDQASGPTPEDARIDVLRDAVLNWEPSEYAVKHDVYLGTVFSDVNDASVGNDRGVLASQGQSDATYAPGILDFGQTYFWRIDEVNGAPDSTVFKGKIWRFTVEPIANPIENITAMASGANADMGPEKTIDGFGLNDMDQHDNDPMTMWLTMTADSWIQYEFDQAYKLHEMLIWNSNQIVEPFIGFGVKEATIETSVDGENWVVVDGVGELAKGTGASTYTANSNITMGGIMAKFVRLTPISAYGLTGQSGLAEVRFLAVPVAPREPQPADGATTAGVAVELAWRSGREAASHQVYLGTDAANMALIDTVDTATTTTDALDYNTTYFWSITEVNDAAAPTVHAGDLWSFSTPESAIVDDFELFSGDEGEEIFMTWFDGFGGDAALGGSTTGHIDGPFVETSIVYGGGQSMPIYVDNDGSFANIDGQVSSPNFSEVVRDLDGQDWTASGIETLSIMFAGSPGLTGQLYCKIGSTKLTYDGDAANLGLGAWQAWNIDLSTVGGNLTNVRALAIGVEGGTSGILYVDEIRLYTQVGAYITPAEPGTANLVGHWTFDEGAGAVAADASGNGNAGNVVNGSWQPGKIGSALSFTGTTHVEIPAGAWATVDTQVTIACWNYAEVTPANNVIFGAYLTDNGEARVASAHLPWGGNVYFDTSGTEAGGYDRINKAIQDSEYLGAWHHWAFVKNAHTGRQEIYLDGSLWHSADGMTKPTGGAGVTIFHLGADPMLGGYYNGLVDDFQLYNEALSQEEILWIAGRTSPVAKPF